MAVFFLCKCWAVLVGTLQVTAQWDGLTNVKNPARIWEFERSTVWSENGPYYKDIVQNQVWNCWLPAASTAVAWAAPDWLSHLFHHTDGTPLQGEWNPSAQELSVSVWNTQNGHAQEFVVDVWSQSNTEDHPGRNWWHSALQQAILQLASDIPIEGIYSNGTFWHSNGRPDIALALVTGVMSRTRWQGSDRESDYHGDMTAWFDDLSVAWKSPVVIATVDHDVLVPNLEPTQLLGNHAYAVLYTTDYGNGTLTAHLRNPWGRTDEYELSGVWRNLLYLAHLDGFQELHWGA